MNETKRWCNVSYGRWLEFRCYGGLEKSDDMNVFCVKEEEPSLLFFLFLLIHFSRECIGIWLCHEVAT